MSAATVGWMYTTREIVVVAADAEQPCIEDLREPLTAASWCFTGAG